MAHFAELDENNVVLQVIVVSNDAIDPNDEEATGIAFLTSLYGHSNWKQTSIHGNIRKNWAYIGSVYDETRDAFVQNKSNCHAEEIFYEELCKWGCTNSEHLNEIEWLFNQE